MVLPTHFFSFLILLACLLPFFSDQLRISFSVTLCVSTITVLIATISILVRKSILAHRLKHQTGVEKLIGQTALVKEKISANHDGQIYINGELWIAHSKESVAVGEKVKIKEVQGNLVFVEREF